MKNKYPLRDNASNHCARMEEEREGHLPEGAPPAPTLPRGSADATVGSKAIAHIRKDATGHWAEPHTLIDHTIGVSRLSERFADSFGNGDWGRALGQWHDLGKYKSAFQRYIRESSGWDEEEGCSSGKVDHSIVGALWAARRCIEASPEIGRALGYCIAGHHAGLPNWSHDIGYGGSLADRLKEGSHLDEALSGKPPEEILALDLPSSPPGAREPKEENDGEISRQMHLWIRMLFSCLVDADFLDTEAYMDKGKASIRELPYASIPELKGRFDAYMMEKASLAPGSEVNKVRARILAECREHASWSPGAFSLTVPTGGGKTLSGMAFALDHALRHGKKRIVVAIPYTSIIDQTAKQYREVFGDANVIEHHSNLDPAKDTERSRLASENWDAPIIVTTNVQLFEALFAARTSACRKLHNLVDSVIILDEAQMLAPEYLDPIVAALRGLVELFGVSLILSTATQPALARTITSGRSIFHGFPDGFVREIISDPTSLAHALRRVEISIHGGSFDPVSWESIAKEVSDLDQALCVVNTRKDCRDLYELLPEGSVHLSALMCPEHRCEVLGGSDGIKAKLSRGESLRVVSTQLVEAGVDIDFPVVYRALAGFDSIAQAAGRCNREGSLNAQGRLGKTIVFRPPKDAPIDLLRKGQTAGIELFTQYPEECARLDPEVFEKYFSLFYSKVNSLDAKGIMQLLAGADIEDLKIQFRTAAARFKLIDDAGQGSVIVWYDREASDGRPPISSAELVDRLERAGPDRYLMRSLQRFTVTLPERIIKALRTTGSIREVEGLQGLFVQNVAKLYDPVFGLRVEGPNLSAEDFIA